MLTPSQKQALRKITYLAGFCLNLSTAIGAYVNSSFIEQFVGERSVGIVYSLAALGSLIAAWLATRLMHRLGNRRVLVVFGLLNALSLILTLVYRNSASAVWLVAGYTIFSFLAAINLDIYLEELSDDRTTGRIRGLFLTMSNLAWLLSPFLAARVVSSVGFAGVYAIALVALIPFLYLSIFKLRNISTTDSERLSWGAGLSRLLGKQGHNLRRIITLDFLLNFFYAVMIIYIPIYLHQHVGLDWPAIGLVFTIMLIPFVTLDFILGKIADQWLGERELLIAGLLITIGACLVVPLTESQTAFAWAGVLLLSRIGAATLEMMKETYLFKQIDGRDANIIFISRNMYPLAYLVAPLVASVFLLYWPLQQLFFLLGLIMALGLPAALNLKDTR